MCVYIYIYTLDLLTQRHHLNHSIGEPTAEKVDLRITYISSSTYLPNKVKISSLETIASTLKISAHSIQ